ncbi:5-oxoprolinase [Sphingobacterium sp. lm-10]|uniref:5-oxoprolinase n=1 Tax=Sphingobacterium sp. lm-10 TaxID=2944904 RepID=UPI0020227283|nr:5-oxoprolinase [Sphingobacterium sp. lm-10]MCL7986746.1 5-oxoprolinase [Sphingobacterium sp. lm-10]
MQTPNELYQHLVQNFHHYSVKELVNLNNDLVRNKSWGTQKAAFRTAVLNSLARKGVDLSRIVSHDDGFTTIQLVPVELGDDNTLIPLAC